MPPIIISSLIYIITTYSVFRGGFTDPGILERQMESDFYSPRRNIIRQVINGHIHPINFCFTCNLFRPPRCSHCATCDNCVRRFDHHCIWLGNCIGVRNHKFFYFLVSSLIVNGIFQIGYCIYFIVFQSKKKVKKFNLLIYISFSFVIFFDVCFIVFFLGKLCLLHSWLIFTNTTFYEYFKKKWKKIPGFNPFSLFCGYHSCRLLFFSSNKSYLHLRKEDYIRENDSIEIRKESENEKFNNHLITNVDGDLVDKQIIYKNIKNKGKY